MVKVLQRYPLLFLLVAVVLSSSVLYAIMMGFHSIFPFNRANYVLRSHHFLADSRVDDGSFVFLRALGQYDAQWYLRIAAKGYPPHPTVTNIEDKSTMDGLTYAFFPLYPSLIAATNVIIGNVERSAFLVSNLLIILNVLSLYFVIRKQYTSSLAIKTTLLLFLFPFSIFFRSYFAEGLQLFLLIWFAFFLMQKRMLPATFFLALLNVAKGNCILLNILFGVYIAQHTLTYKQEWPKTLLSLGVVALPLCGWIAFNYMQTGDPFYFHTVYQQWDDTPFYLLALDNLRTMAHLFSLPFHDFHYSFLDTCIAIITLVMLVLSWKRLPHVLWWISFLLWLTPFISHDLMSFSRYQSVSFPLFLFASQLSRNNKIFIPIAGMSFYLLLITSLYFVNWYWIG